MKASILENMGIARGYLSHHKKAIPFDVEALGRALESECPYVVFVLLMGSSREGTVRVGGDLDLALYVQSQLDLKQYSRIADIADWSAPEAFCDIGILNWADPVFRFEALKGRLLFTRSLETYASFFSLTCREYESQLADYERQFRYRRETA